MEQQLHERLIEHYKGKGRPRGGKHGQVESIIKQTLQKKHNEEDQLSPFQDFLRNETHIAAQPSPLEFRSFPSNVDGLRDLKVFFPGPPEPPPVLEEVPYTYEMVQKVPFKLPKQKRGTVGEWVVRESGFVDRREKSVTEHRTAERVQQGHHQDLADKRQVFRKAVKKLAVRMREDNLSLREIERNKGLVKKSFNYYNSRDFFALVKGGEREAEQLLEANPYLAFDVDDFKMTPLHWAAREGHAYLTKTLLQRFRANTGAKDMYGRTPLHLAVAKKQIPCLIRIFVEGGQLSVQDGQKRTVRAVAPDSYTRYLLQKLEEVKFIIRARGLKEVGAYRSQLQKHVKFVLDEASLYF